MITILMSIYDGENSQHFEEALKSLVQQSESVDEVLLVLDGPIRAELKAVISNYSRLLPLRVLPLKNNRGLAVALNYGLDHVGTPWVMRFDTDDISIPSRVKQQKEIMLSSEFDIFGSQIHEFMNDPDVIVQSRVVPLDHEAIKNFSRLRNPFNHMTVCFKTDLVKKCGGYPHLPYMEDYALWAKLIVNGARTCNSADSLVKARVGAGMYSRRGGLEYVKCEFALQKFLHGIGQKSRLQSLTHGLVRASVFGSPLQLRRWIYENKLRVRR